MELQPFLCVWLFFFFRIDANKYFPSCGYILGEFVKKNWSNWPNLVRFKAFFGLKSILSCLKRLECMCKLFSLKMLPQGIFTSNEYNIGQSCQISGLNDLIWPKPVFLHPRNLYQKACSFYQLLMFPQELFAFCMYLNR